MPKCVLSTHGLSKTFGSVKAISNVDFSLAEGEIHAIIGPNGAGKSTLVKLLSGEMTPDAGGISLNGESVVLTSPACARSHGISMVPQDFGLINSMSVAENISLTDSFGPPGIYSPAAAAQQAKTVLRRLSVPIEPSTSVSQLSVAEKQLVAIAKALKEPSSVIIFDEPTAVLHRHSRTTVTDQLRRLKASGKSVIYVTHHLDEVFEIADTVSVLIDGLLVLTSSVNGIRTSDLLKYFGSSGSSQGSADPRANSSPLLVVENLTTTSIDGVSFTVNVGDSVGIVSDTHTEAVELMESIFGAIRKRSGKVTIRGRPVTSPATAIANGVGFLPEDRRRDGLFGLLSVLDNLTLLMVKSLSRIGVVQTALLSSSAKTVANDLRVKYDSLRQPVSELSGGNQQKVLLARWIARDFDLLLLLEPTAGIDLRGRADIHEIVSALRRRGKSFVVASSDERELAGICNKILVLQQGRPQQLIGADQYFGGRDS